MKDDNYLDIDLEKTTTAIPPKGAKITLPAAWHTGESFEAAVREIVRDELANILTYGVPEDFEKYMDRKVKESEGFEPLDDKEGK